MVLGTRIKDVFDSISYLNNKERKIMKKFLLITMCLVFVLSFAACTKDSAENNDSVVSDEVTTENTAKDTVADTTEEETTEAEPEAAFDTSWASNDYEKLIPQPPMQIARSYDDGEKWVITNLISGSKLAEDPKYPVTADASKDDFLAYIDQLRTLGFVDSGELYENKTEIEEVIGAFFRTPDEKYYVTVWYEDNYIFSITIDEIIPET